MRVIATRRPTKQSRRARYVEKLLPAEQLKQLFTESDYVAVTLRFTQETREIIGEDEPKAMKSTTHIINTGRGGLINEKAWFCLLSVDFHTHPLYPPLTQLFLPGTINQMCERGEMNERGLRLLSLRTPLRHVKRDVSIRHT